jgi:hypothetical protein
MEMTLIYARIANRVVADEYQAISAKIDALYGQQLELPADYETTGMAKLRREATARMLGNGLCTRPSSWTAFVGHPACDVDNLAADLHRFVFLLGLNDGEQVFGEPTP